MSENVKCPHCAAEIQKHSCGFVSCNECKKIFKVFPKIGGGWDIQVLTQRDMSFNNDPICPNCHRKEQDAFEYNLLDGESEETECDCGAVYEVTRHVEVTYSTKLIRIDEGQDA